MDGLRTEMCGQPRPSNDPRNNQHNPQYANYWAPLTRKRHIPPHPAQPQHTNHWYPRTRKRHQQEHRPQRPTVRSNPTQHAKGRTSHCPGPRQGTTTRRNVTRGGGGVPPSAWSRGRCLSIVESDGVSRSMCSPPRISTGKYSTWSWNGGLSLFQVSPSLRFNSHSHSSELGPQAPESNCRAVGGEGLSDCFGWQFCFLCWR